MRYSYMMWSVQGIATSGAFFYNHKDGNNQVAASTEGETFDTCMGHADPMCRYHYHKAPVCIPSSCSVIGYLRDGVPVYGICDVEGQRLKSCYRLRLILNQRYNTDRLPEATKIEALTRAQAFQITNHKITNHQYTRFTFTKPFFTQTIIFTNPKNHNLFILQFHLSTNCLFHKLFLLQTVHIYSKISRSPDVLK